MKRFRQVIRAVLVSLLLLAIVLPAGLFIVMSTPKAHEAIRRTAVSELSTLLGTDVSIDRIDYHPFNTLAVYGVRIDDPAGKPALQVAALSARFELWHFLRTGRLIFDYAVVDAPQVHLYRTDPDSPLNVQPILDRLSSKDKSKPPTKFDLKVGTLMLRNGHATYDVLSAPRLTDRLDVNHLSADSINLYTYLRHITDSTADVRIESMGLRERSGLCITDFTAAVTATPQHLQLTDFALTMPGSRLALDTVALDIDGYGSVGRVLADTPLHLRTDGTARIATADMAPLAPALRGLDRTLELDIDVSASLNSADISLLHITDGRGLKVALQGKADNFRRPADMTADLRKLDITLSAADGANAVAAFRPKLAQTVRLMGPYRITGSVDAARHRCSGEVTVHAGGGTIEINGTVTARDERLRDLDFDGEVAVSNVSLTPLPGMKDFGSVTLTASAGGTTRNGRPEVEGGADISSLIFKGYEYTGISLDGSWSASKSRMAAHVAADDPNARLTLDVEALLPRRGKELTLQADVRRLDANALHLTGARRGYALSGRVSADLRGDGIDDVDGSLRVSDVVFGCEGADSLLLKRFDLVANRNDSPQTVTVTSDILNGTIEGNFNPSTLVPTLCDMASHVVPAFMPHDERRHMEVQQPDKANDFDIDLVLSDAEQVSKFFNLPVQIIYPIDITGTVSSTRGLANLTIDAPYLQQKDKIIDNTVVSASIDTRDDLANVYITTHMPTKKGPMSLVAGIKGADNTFTADADWQIERRIPLNGHITFATTIGRGADGRPAADTRFAPGEINFGDDIWHIHPASLLWNEGKLTSTGFALTTDTGQSIAIDGVAGPEYDDEIVVRLDGIHLASIFETLEIDKALIGGTATGTVSARQALSSLPVLNTRNLHVDQIAYNYCTLGDADVSARWDNERSSFFLDADVVNPAGQHSRIYGDIFPMSESLDLNFEATDIKVGFMRPFMEAFADDVEGYVSGRARLFGTFKNIDMEGDVYARDLRLKIGFTNTWYSATDSIHIRPGLIELNDITIRDVNGHTAKLGGWLRHDFFHNPVFDFNVTDARNFLSYNVTPKLSPDWYGTVYGNGSARIQGRPGVVDIGVNMSTAPGSVFTFVLSDRLEAEQYSFINFRDVTPVTREDSLIAVTDEVPEQVRLFKERMQAAAADEPSDYRMDIQVDITPDAQMVIVMDPVGGDRIRAYGEGDLRMTYNSGDNDLRMYGTYTLERGNYNFTLQDIIIKDFTINRGSSITFRGDPYSAQLDIEAVYAVNANLSDLDESFLQDKDLNRTNVPVQALLKVTGDMRQPDIAFDLNFPTLTSDTYRKVRSIISTDDMMNRQIIYLLALNRFYTPDYMASTTKGNELFSVASSTIASQLSSMLGKLSENWSIAPNLRSDRGDFSDFEVDVALSSRLLNNRLLFNGNFGYRDNSLNSNQFVGDFDIEYLLTPKGTWRLKAYNRYNDQNYYVRTAATTQGVGIMFRRDFDSLFGRRKKKDQTSQTGQTGQTSQTPETPEVPDSVR